MSVRGPGSETFKACVVMPALNEEKKIAAVVESVRRYCPDVIVVDDGSTDRTQAMAETAKARVVRHAVNQGKGAALNTGFQAAREAGFDVVITMDSDGQHDPACIPDFLETYRRTGFHVLVGNRMTATQDMPRLRYLTNRFMSWMLGRMMGQYVPDTQCGYRLYRCDVLPHVSPMSPRYAAESETLLLVSRRGIRIGAVPIPTIYGDEKSKINPVTDTFRFLSMLWRFSRRHPLPG